MKALREFHQSIFAYGSPIALGLFRILVGALSLVNWLMISHDFDAWFTERGYYPIAFMDRWNEGIPRLNVLAGVTDTRVTAFVFGLTILASLLTMLGLWTRLATIALFVLTVSLHYRSPHILHSGDTLLRQWIFVLAIGPSGAACSLDRLFKLRKGIAPIPHVPVSLWPQRFAQFQLSLVYFSTVWAKMRGTMWAGGTALYMVPQLHEFDRFPVPPFIFQAPLLQVFTWSTLLIELSLATLVYARPLRKWVLGLGLMLHFGIDWTMNIPLFAYTIMAGFVMHYEGEEVRDWWARLRVVCKIPGRILGIPLDGSPGKGLADST